MSDFSGPAFPVNELNQSTGQIAAQWLGMSLRNYLAAHAPPMPPALNEIAKMEEKRDGKDTSDFGAYAKLLSDWRYVYADAMLKASTE